jgi:hypothetical protein
MKYPINFDTLLFIPLLVCAIPCSGFSDTYFYELYLHNEYYSEPPGFPSKFVISPIISSFINKGYQSWEKRFSFGVVGSLRLTHDHAWIEFIAALGQEHVRFNHQGKIGKKSRFGGDDFLIDIGYNFLLDEKGKLQLLLHWLTGIPTKWQVTLAEIEEPLFGTRTFATGPVIEFAYDFIRTIERDVFIGFIGRILHRFKRTYQPIIPPNASFNPGNAIDIVSLFHYRYYGHNVEFGYVYTADTDLSYRFPNHLERLPSDKFNSIYFEYFYYHNRLAMLFEIGMVKTFGKTTEGIAFWGLIEWYF